MDTLTTVRKNTHHSGTQTQGLPGELCPKLQTLPVSRATSEETGSQMPEFHRFVSFLKVRKDTPYVPTKSGEKSARKIVQVASVLMNIRPSVAPPKPTKYTLQRLTPLKSDFVKDKELCEEVGA